MNKLLISLLSLVFLSGCFPQTQQTVQPGMDETSKTAHETTLSTNYVTIKYRDTQVNIDDSAFEYLDTSKSSLVRDAWYDSDNKYMIINLNGTYYHYCGMPDFAWTLLKSADSFGSYYQNEIKGSYDCRINYVPTY